MTPTQPLLLCTGRVSKPDDSGDGGVRVVSPLWNGEIAYTAGANTARSVIDRAEDGQEIELFYRFKQKPSTQKRAGKKQTHK
jgi:hypothetical protein